MNTLTWTLLKIFLNFYCEHICSWSKNISFLFSHFLQFIICICWNENAPYQVLVTLLLGLGFQLRNSVTSETLVFTFQLRNTASSMTFYSIFHSFRKIEYSDINALQFTSTLTLGHCCKGLKYWFVEAGWNIGTCINFKIALRGTRMLISKESDFFSKQYFRIAYSTNATRWSPL